MKISEIFVFLKQKKTIFSLVVMSGILFSGLIFSGLSHQFGILEKMALIKDGLHTCGPRVQQTLASFHTYDELSPYRSRDFILSTEDCMGEVTYLVENLGHQLNPEIFRDMNNSLQAFHKLMTQTNATAKVVNNYFSLFESALLRALTSIDQERTWLKQGIEWRQFFLWVFYTLISVGAIGALVLNFREQKRSIGETSLMGEDHFLVDGNTKKNDEIEKNQEMSHGTKNLPDQEMSERLEEVERVEEFKNHQDLEAQDKASPPLNDLVTHALSMLSKRMSEEKAEIEVKIFEGPAEITRRDETLQFLYSLLSSGLDFQENEGGQKILLQVKQENEKILIFMNVHLDERSQGLDQTTLHEMSSVIDHFRKSSNFSLCSHHIRTLGGHIEIQNNGSTLSVKTGLPFSKQGSIRSSFSQNEGKKIQMKKGKARDLLKTLGFNKSRKTKKADISPS